MGERDRYPFGYERDRARRDDYSEHYDPQRPRGAAPEHEWHDDRGRYAGYYADRRYGTRGPDEREEGSRYGGEEGFRQSSARPYRDDTEARRYSANDEHHSEYERQPRSNYVPGPYQSRPAHAGSWQPRNQQWGEYSSPQRSMRSADWSPDYQRDETREHGRHNESFGEQVREAGQRIARTVKRAFRGPKGYKRSDERIREDVSDRLGDHAYLDCTDVEVSVTNAEVTLTGTVRTRQEKFVAEEIADDVSGVTDVHNQLRVRREQSSQESHMGASNVTSGSTEAARNRNARA